MAATSDGIYLEFFRLKRRPFTAAPDPAFFYPSEKHREAVACILYAIEQRKGFALITGEVGAGKTTMCRAALARLDRTVDTAMITNTALTAKQLLEAICDEYELERRPRSKFELLRLLNEFLIARYGQNRHVVLIIDEAQNLDKRVLEEVRLLGNLETDQDKLLQIILVGQPELRRKIASVELRQLNQRIAVKFHLQALTPEETVEYIDYRLRVAGAEEEIFGLAAKIAVHAFTGGIPRLINLICDHALLQAYTAERHQVDEDLVRGVVGDLEGDYLDPKPDSAAPPLF